MKRTSPGYLALLTLSFLLQGCIKEDLADCNFNIAVEFLEQANCSVGPVHSEAGNITIFAFNESGVFVDQFSDDHAVFGSSYKLPVNLPQGNYTLVAWAGFVSSQFDAKSLIKGKTSLSELYMPSYRLRNGTKEATHQPVFTGVVSNINAINGGTQLISLTATAKPLTINVSGFPVNHTYQARISYNAVQYKFENSLLSLLADDHYTMAGLITKTGGSDLYQAETSLLWPVSRYNPALTIRDLTTGTDVFNADIKLLIAQLTQIDLDCERAITIEITMDRFHPAEAKIVINGWKVQYINNEI